MYDFLKQTIQILQQINEKNAHQVSADRIRTHDHLNLCNQEAHAQEAKALFCSFPLFGRNFISFALDRTRVTVEACLRPFAVVGIQIRILWMKNAKNTLTYQPRCGAL